MECGGAERQISYLAPEMARLGHDVHVAYLKGGINLSRLKSSKVNLHPIPCSSNYDIRIFYHLFHLIQKVQPEVLQTWIFQMDIVAGLLSRFFKIPWVLREPANKLSTPYNVRNTLRLILGKKADAIIANSTSGYLYWSYSGYKGNCKVIPNAIPNDDIVFNSTNPFNKYGLDKNDNVILYVGKIDNNIKNVFNLFYSVLPIVKMSNNYAILCGDGPDKLRLQNLINKHMIRDKIILAGETSNVLELMKNAKVLLQISNTEGMPNVLLEGIICECPIILSDIPGHRDVLSNDSAFFVNHHNIDNISKTIKFVLENRDIAKSKAKNAKSKVANLSISNITNKYIQIYRDVISKRGLL